MAGLSANIITRAMPSWPRPTTAAYYYGQTEPGGPGDIYFEAFQNDSVAGSGLKVLVTSGGQEAITYYNGQGTQITDGVWAGAGFLPSEAWSDADEWSSLYMDSSDNKLYALVIDTGTDPDTYRMTSVDKDGTVVLETAALQVTNTGFNNKKLVYNPPHMYRVGHVDGTGNFRFDLMKANTDDDDASAPFDGCRLEINTSGGTVNGISANTIAETTDGLLPSNFYTPRAVDTNLLGPTSNNIMGGPWGALGASQGDPRHTGSLINMTTGNSSYEMPFGKDCPFVPRSANPSYSVTHWLGTYRFFAPGGAYTLPAGGAALDRGEFHNFMDELAVFYGIL